MASELDPAVLLRTLTVEEWLMARPTVLRLHAVYRKQKRAAIVRHIEFLLSFREWIEIWAQSSKLSQRGRRRGQYVMARLADRGPYKVGNVRIITNAENIREAHEGTRHSAESIVKMSLATMGHPVSATTRKKLRRYWEERRVSA